MTGAVAGSPIEGDRTKAVRKVANLSVAFFPRLGLRRADGIDDLSDRVGDGMPRVADHMDGRGRIVSRTVGRRRPSG